LAHNAWLVRSTKKLQRLRNYETAAAITRLATARMLSGDDLSHWSTAVITGDGDKSGLGQTISNTKVVTTNRRLSESRVRASSSTSSCNIGDASPVAVSRVEQHSLPV